MAQHACLSPLRPPSALGLSLRIHGAFPGAYTGIRLWAAGGRGPHPVPLCSPTPHVPLVGPIPPSKSSSPLRHSWSCISSRKPSEQLTPQSFCILLLAPLAESNSSLWFRARLAHGQGDPGRSQRLCSHRLGVGGALVGGGGLKGPGQPPAPGQAAAESRRPPAEPHPDGWPEGQREARLAECEALRQGGCPPPTGCPSASTTARASSVLECYHGCRDSTY